MEDQRGNMRQQLKALGISSSKVSDIELIIKYFTIVTEARDVPLLYETDVYDLAVLQTLINMAASHEAFQDLDELEKQAIERFKGFCRRIWIARGLTVDEAKRLDRLLLDAGTSERGKA